MTTTKHIGLPFHSTTRGTSSVAMSFGLAVLLTLVAVSPALAQTLTVLYSFTGGTHGSLPTSRLVRDAGGSLYGATFRGGDLNCANGEGCGVLFRIDVNGNETVLHSFTGGIDGAYPTGNLIRDAAGNLYGTAYSGGDLACGDGDGCGTVFKLSPRRKFTVLHAFTGGTDGSNPDGGVMRDSAGSLYGTTSSGGTAVNGGTVFKIDAAGKETVLYRFTGKTDGGQPLAGVIQDADGNLFGTTLNGGNSLFDAGTVFKVDPTGKETVLHTFIPSHGADGGTPYAGLVPFGQSLYGMTTVGGTSNFGTVFELDKADNETVLYSFAGGTDGRYPDLSGVIHDPAGNLYGTTQNGGDSTDDGTVFELDQAGHETVLHRFNGSDGSRPAAGVIRDSAGNLYGTTYQGGPIGYGAVFKLTP